MLKSPRIFLALLAAVFIAGIVSCHIGERSLDELNLFEFKYRDHSPVNVQIYDSSTVSNRVPAAWVLKNYAFSYMAELEYAATPGDTLHIRILEFSSEISALAFYLNSGLVQETLPVIEGDSRELAMRSGRRLFVFRYGLLRNHGRGELERYVQGFPNYRAGLPQEFLSLPFTDRVPGETSIQMQNFFGVPASFPMLVQGYRGNDVRWSAARSWNSVSEDSWNGWVAKIRNSGRLGELQGDTLSFDAGAGERGLALRLKGGRIVCVWGSLSPDALRERFGKIAKNVYDSPE